MVSVAPAAIVSGDAGLVLPHDMFEEQTGVRLNVVLVALGF